MPPARTSSAPSKAASSAPAKSGAYTVLARRYRSRDFNELIGQEPIARTLQNAIATGRLAHAYLFCGTRGVGKTSMARIFAKALNATPDLKERDAIAEAILRGDDLDVIEIDGASNRGVNEARDLIANAGLSPARCKYKIYIIDEVHALTKEAFNALLKTMEEPPPHVKFILCTTEANKVPITIQSRCQRFDFRPIPTSQIARNLKTILDKEGIKASPDVIAQVARLGQGSMRDALSTLDRLLASADGALTTELVEQMLGLPDHQRVAAVVDAVAAGNAADVLARGAELLNSGTSIEQALESLAEHFRTLLVAASCGENSDLLDVTAEARESAARQAASFDLPTLVHMIALCDAVGRHVRFSSAARAIYDAALVRMTLRDQLAPAAAMLSTTTSGSASPSAVAKKKDDVTPALSPREAFQREVQAASLPRTPAPSPAAPRVEVKPSPAAVAIAPDENAWAAIQRIMRARQRFRVMLDDLEHESTEGDTVRLCLREHAAARARMVQNELSALNDALRQASGRPLRVIVDAEAAPPPPPPIAAPELDEVRKQPAVAMAMSLFGAVISAVERVPDEAPIDARREAGDV